MAVDSKKQAETAMNKVGIDVHTRKLLNDANKETGIPRSRIVRDALERYVPRLIAMKRQAS